MAKPKRPATKERTSSIVSEIVAVGVIVSSAVVVDPFGFQAFLLLRYAVTLLLVLAATVVMWRQGIALPKNRAIRIAVPGFLAVLLVSSMLARAPLVAVLGAAGRQLGWLAWMMFAVAFIAGLSLFERSEDRRVETALVIGFASAIIGVGVIAGLELVGAPVVEVNQQFGSRLQASFGNPAVLGAFMTLGLPVIAGGLLARRLPILAGTAAAIGTALLVLSGARGAWIGVAVGVIFAVVSVGYRQSRQTLIRVGTVAAVVVLVVLGLTVFTGRWATATSGLEGRLATWQVAGAVVVANPVVGVGPEGFATAFAETVDDEYVIRYTRDDVIDRAHNGMLEVATSAGFVGLALYALLIAGVVAVAWKAARIGDRVRPVTVGAAAGLVAYLVQQQAFFQLAVLDLAFWLVVGLLATTAGMSENRRRIPALGVALFALVGAAVLYTVFGVYADRQDQAALEGGDTAEAMSRLERAAVIRPSDDIHAIIAASIAGEAGVATANAAAGRMVDEALAVDPTSGALILKRSALLVDAYELMGAEGALDVARSDLNLLVARDATNGEAYLRLGAIAYYQGEPEAARAYWTRSAHLMPHRSEPFENLKLVGG